MLKKLLISAEDLYDIDENAVKQYLKLKEKYQIGA